MIKIQTSPYKPALLTRRGLMLAGVPALGLTALAGAGAWRLMADGPETSPIGKAVFLLSETEPEVLVLNAYSGALERSIGLKAAPTRLVIAESPDRIVAADPGTRLLWQMKPEAETALPALELDIEPLLLSASPGGGVLAVLDWGLGVLDLRSGAGARRMTGMEGAHDLRFSHDGALLFVAFIDRSEIWKIEVATGEVMQRIELPDAPGIDHMIRTIDGALGLAVAPPGLTEAVFPVDLMAGEALAPLPVAAPIRRAATDAFGRYIFLPHLFDGMVEVMDVRRREIIARPVFSAPVTGLLPGFLGATMVALSAETGDVTELDLDTFAITSQIRLPGIPGGAAAHEPSGRIFAPMPEIDGVAMIETRGARLSQKMLGLPGKRPIQAFAKGALSFCHG